LERSLPDSALGVASNIISAAKRVKSKKHRDDEMKIGLGDPTRGCQFSVMYPRAMIFGRRSFLEVEVFKLGLVF
jgi:hypothetical protein